MAACGLMKLPRLSLDLRGGHGKVFGRKSLLVRLRVTAQRVGQVRSRLYPTCVRRLEAIARLEWGPSLLGGQQKSPSCLKLVVSFEQNRAFLAAL